MSIDKGFYSLASEIDKCERYFRPSAGCLFELPDQTVFLSISVRMIGRRPLHRFLRSVCSGELTWDAQILLYILSEFLPFRTREHTLRLGCQTRSEGPMTKAQKSWLRGIGFTLAIFVIWFTLSVLTFQG